MSDRVSEDLRRCVSQARAVVITINIIAIITVNRIAIITISRIAIITISRIAIVTTINIFYNS